MFRTRTSRLLPCSRALGGLVEQAQHLVQQSTEEVWNRRGRSAVAACLDRCPALRSLLIPICRCSKTIEGALTLPNRGSGFKSK